MLTSSFRLYITIFSIGLNLTIGGCAKAGSFQDSFIMITCPSNCARRYGPQTEDIDWNKFLGLSKREAGMICSQVDGTHEITLQDGKIYYLEIRTDEKNKIVYIYKFKYSGRKAE